MNKDCEAKFARVVMNKIVSDKEVSEMIQGKEFHDVLQGKKYDFDMTVRLQGSFKQGIDHEGQISQRVKWQQMFICLLEEYQKVCLSAKTVGVNLKTLAKNAAKLEEELGDLAEEKAKKIAEEIKETSVGTIRGRISCNVVPTVMEVSVNFTGEVEEKKKK